MKISIGVLLFALCALLFAPCPAAYAQRDTMRTSEDFSVKVLRAAPPARPSASDNLKQEEKLKLEVKKGEPK